MKQNQRVKLYNLNLNTTAVHNMFTTMWYCAIFRPTKARSQELALGLQQRGYLCHILLIRADTE